MSTEVTDRIFLKLDAEPLDLLACYEFVQDSACGAVSTFVGFVRDHNSDSDKEVTFLEFEAYPEMALKEMRNIADQAFDKWPCKKIAIHHRIGRTNIQEVPVIIAVSTPHRKESFQACQFVIDELKRSVPIWKKECYRDGQVWVGSTP